MNKIVLITGATEGVGKATAVGIARQAGYHVVLHGRDEAKTRAAVEEVKRLSGSAAVDYLLADFATLAGAHQLADAFAARYDRLDVLINNAAAMFAARRESADGLEMHFAVNYLAPFVLTHRLLPLLQRAGHARIINLSSVGYKSAKPNFDDLQATRRYSMQTEYFNSKLYLLYFSLDLAEQLRGTGITVNAVHPGGVRTQLARDFRGPMRWLFALMMPLFFLSPEQGAETSVYLATDPALVETTGQYFVKKKPEALTPIGTNAANRRRLREATLRLASLASYSLPA